VLAPTPPDRLTDAKGRPYFLWDMEMTLDELRERLSDRDAPERAYLLGKILRQAKPDDALQFVPAQEISDHWAELERYLGRTRDFWQWLIAEWSKRGIIRR
jgi:hypothetical protein